MDTLLLVETFELEGRLLDATLRRHPRLRPLFTRELERADRAALKDAYLRLLRLEADHAQLTVRALRTAAEALRDGDSVDVEWSRLFLGYAGATEDDQGVAVLAYRDMRALGAAPELVSAPLPAAAEIQGRYFIDDAARHPYAILGAKGVLERFSLRVAGDLVAGVLASGIPNADQAVRFLGRRGVRDIERVREGDRNLYQLAGDARRLQVLEGAYFTSGIYRSLVRSLLPS